jgi:aminomethyltransferase
MLVYRLAPTRWLIVCNAINRAKIIGWLEKNLPARGVSLRDLSDETALLAVQGPSAGELMQRVSSLKTVAPEIEALGYYSGLTLEVGGSAWLISRTGYTGERGYEIYLPYVEALALWEELLAAGQTLGTLPIGLAARDTLRFEMAYCLYGHELSEEITPLEAGIGWAVKLKKPDFNGREALLQQKKDGVPRCLIGLEIEGKAIARQGAMILSAGHPIGQVTSGNFSPTLKKSLAMALVQAPLPGEDLQVEIRGKPFPCCAVSLPFLMARVKGDPRAERAPRD